MFDSKFPHARKFAHVFDRVDGLAEKGNRIIGICPSHKDEKGSLVFLPMHDRLLVKCHANCSFHSVVAALGLKERDFYCNNPNHDDGSKVTTMAKKEIESVHEYNNEDGDLLYQIVKSKSKDFHCRRRPKKDDPKDKVRQGWVYGVEGIRRVLYNLDVLQKNAASGRVLFIVEGEKDVDILAKNGMLATCNPFGAGKWLSGYSEFLKGWEGWICVVPDNDDQGREHAKQVYKSLREHEVPHVTGFRVPVIGTMPKEKSDTYDYLTKGGSKEEFQAMAKKAIDKAKGSQESQEEPVANESVVETPNDAESPVEADTSIAASPKETPGQNGNAVSLADQCTYYLGLAHNLTQLRQRTDSDALFVMQAKMLVSAASALSLSHELVGIVLGTNGVDAEADQDVPSV